MHILIFLLNYIIIFLCLSILSPFVALIYIFVDSLITFFAYDGVVGNLIINKNKINKYIQIESNEQKKIIISAKLMIFALRIGIIIITIMIFGVFAVLFLALLITFGYFFLGRNIGMSLSGFVTIFDIAKNSFVCMNNYLNKISLKIILTELKVGLNYDG
ncbi:hypothetical protein [Thomasclavelia sp.]|uniref:hypothetical protein n=1 Tax=Thomasclavelia sp. TaxID=3025757 RepID=UPI0025D62E39|nr:hypothetical protein [Thomasclavelia sp.]